MIPKIRLVSHIEITPAVIIELDERDLYFLFVVSEKNYHVILEWQGIWTSNVPRDFTSDIDFCPSEILEVQGVDIRKIISWILN